MTVPQKPSTDGLKSGLTNISRVVKTSRFRFSNWNIKPFTQLMTKFSAKDYQNFSNLTKALREQQGLLKELKDIKKTADVAKESKTVLQNLIGKLPGKNNVAKAAKGGMLLLELLAIIGILVALIMKMATDNIIQDIGIANEIRNESEFQKAFNRYQRTIIDIRALNKKAEQYNLEIQRTKDRVYALEKQQVPIRQKANDALYEVRAGRKILEGKIAEAKKQANDALYEIREGRKILEGKILEHAQKVAEVSKKVATFNVEQFNNLKTQFNSTIETIKKNFATVQESLIAQRNAIDAQRKSLNEQQKELTSTKSVVSQALDLAKKVNPIDLTNSILKIVDGKIEIIQNQVSRQIQPQIDKTNAQLNQVSRTVDANGTEITKIGGVTITSYEGVTRTLRDTYNLSFEAQAAKWNEEMRKQMEMGFKTTSVQVSSQITTAEAVTDKKIQQAKEEIKKDLQKQSTDITSLKTELEKLKKESPTDPRIPQLQSEITKINTQIREQDRLNRTGLERLGELGVMVGGITALMNRMPRDTANLINPNIPTPAGIQQATGTAICNSLSGGCLGGALNNNANNINNNSNRNKDDLLNKLNTGLQIPELALLGTINNKLGDQLPGGLSATFGRLWRTLQVDRILGILTFITTMHNAAMLSNSIGQTLFGVFDNIAQAAGFKWKNEKDEEVGFGGIVGEWSTNFFKSIFGEETFNNLSTTWKRANRIYQAAANIANSVRSMIDSVRSIGEFIAENTGRIGNALKRFGVVGDDAYRWMPEQVNGQSLWVQKLQNLEDAASGIEMVTGEVASIAQNVNEIKEQSDTFKKSLEDSPKKEQSENKAVKESEDASKADSNSPPIPRESERKANS